MTVNNTDVFDVVLKNNVQIKKSDGRYAFFMDSGGATVKSEYQPILRMLHSGASSSEALLAALVDSGTNDVSANLTLAQFLIDCASYIE